MTDEGVDAMPKEYLTENEVIAGVVSYFENKGRTEVKRIVRQSDASKKEHGVDLQLRLENSKGNGNNYFIEAKGNKKADGTVMRSSFNTNFRWAISQIILRISADSRQYHYIYGIAVPHSEIPKCMAMIRHNWALKHLKIRLYGAFRDENGDLTAIEYCPFTIYA